MTREVHYRCDRCGATDESNDHTQTYSRSLPEGWGAVSFFGPNNLTINSDLCGACAGAVLQALDATRIKPSKD